MAPVNRTSPPDPRNDRPRLDPDPTGPLDSGSAVAAAAGAFADGMTVAGRYRIARFLGRGGMGEVYEAKDVELGVTVALKTVSAAATRDTAGVNRLKSEVLLARRVTHANVCRIFDFGQHVHEGAPVTFLTMELLQGETLAARLAREAPYAPARALPMVRQMAAGLAAAHGAGVVHGDFKSANIIVVAGEEGEERVAITDFGVARPVTGSEPFAGGTLAYMAPEQVEGRLPGTAADIYALGVVLYEMVTGRLPFVGKTPMEAARRRLAEEPPSPRSWVPDLDPRWERVILRCLARRPEDRFPTALAVAGALAGESAPRSRARVVAGGAAIALALAAAGLWQQARARRETTSGGRRSVAVLGFRNLSGREGAAWLSPALAEMLATELAAGEQLRLVPGENVARMKADLALTDAQTLAPDTLARVRGHLGSDVVVLGSYVALGGEAGRVRLDLRLQDTRRGETIAVAAEEGTEAEIIDLVQRSGTRLRATLGLPPLRPEATGALRAAQPRTMEAARLYVEGLSRLRTFDAGAAREALAKALAADPDFAPAHSALAETWMALGYDERAREAARRAAQLAGGLPREERFLIEGGLREATHEWPAAVRAYETLTAAFPDDLEHALRLARARTAAGNAKGAVGELERVRRLPPPASSDPRLDLAEASAAEALADFQGQRAAAERALARARAQGARLIAATALLHQAWAWRNLGDPPRALAATREARRAFGEVGDRRSAARARNTEGALLFDGGRLADAQSLFEKNLTDARETGDRRGLQGALANVGLMLLQRGRLAEARPHYEEALTVAREIGHRVSEARTLNNLAEIPYLAGRPAEARRLDEEALALARETGNKGLEANILYDLGDVLAAAGEAEAARHRHQEALALREVIGEKGTALESGLALAGFAVDDGRLEEAEGLARRALAEAVAERRADNEALAHATLALALHAAARHEEARASLARARALAGSSEMPMVRLKVALAAGRVEAADDPAAAARTLDAAAEEARRSGFVLHELEVRLARAEAAVAAGDRADAERRFTAVAKEARSRALLGIARRAEVGRRASRQA